VPQHHDHGGEISRQSLKAAAEYLRLSQSGQVVDLDQLRKSFPDIDAAIRFRLTQEAGAAVGSRDSGSPSPGKTEFVRRANTVIPTSGEIDQVIASGSFAGYRLIKRLSQSSVDTVFLAEAAALKRRVILKLLNFQVADGSVYRERFLQEARIAAKFDHPGIVKIYDADVHENIPYIAMSDTPGMILSEMIGSGVLMEQRRAAEVTLNIAEAMAYAHSEGIIHRNLNSRSVIIRTEGTACISDFELARNEEDASADSGRQRLIQGHPTYIAPEQFYDACGSVTPKTDLYSLGVIFYELLTGKPPFSGSGKEVLKAKLKEAPEPPGKVRPEVDVQLEALCLKLLQKSPAERPESMEIVARWLKKWLKSTRSIEFTATSSEFAAAGSGEERQLKQRQETVSEQIARGQYAAALQTLEEVEKDTERVSPQLSRWIKKTGEEIRSLQSKVRPGVESLVRTAMQLLERSDYGQAADILQQIPSDYRTQKIQNLLAEAISLQDESDMLLADLQKCLRQKHLDGIDDNLNRFLQLKPANSFAVSLSEALNSYGYRYWRRTGFQFDDTGRLLPRSGSAVDGHVIMAVSGLFAMGGVLAAAVLFFMSTGLPWIQRVLEDVSGPGESVASEPAPEIPAPGPLPPAITRAAGEAAEFTDLKIRFIWCPPGTFMMGAAGTQRNVSVTLTEGYWMQQTEVTQGPWMAVMKSEPWQKHAKSEHYRSGADYPAVCVNWFDAADFCIKLTEQERKAGRLPQYEQYSVPTEAQWEYACRSGAQTNFSFGSDGSLLNEYGWSSENTSAQGEPFAHQVSRKRAGPWGLYDMHGNVREWCRDGYQRTLPGGSDPLSDSSKASNVVARGGSRDYSAERCSSHVRYQSSPDVRESTRGFRIIRERIQLPEATQAGLQTLRPLIPDGNCRDSFVEVFRSISFSGVQFVRSMVEASNQMPSADHTTWCRLCISSRGRLFRAKSS
jgi:serine/threonine protein kinase/formylglycine-generating enzyme required for sulfatase activity